MKTYNKHQLKITPSTGKVALNEDGTPILGDILKPNIRFEPHHARTLNVNFEETGVYYAEVKEDKKNEPDEKEIRKNLFEKAQKLGLTPAKNIKTDELEKLITEKETI